MPDEGTKILSRPEGGHYHPENPKFETRPCDVCRLVDGDVTPKQVEWCNFCKAWLCDNDKWNLPRRAKAMTIRASRNVGVIHPEDKDPDRPKDRKVGAK
jgi:hypothetical protein